MLVKKTKHQFIDLVDDIKAILGLNGIIWVYFSTVKVEDEYFNDDKTKIDSLNKEEKPDYNSSILIVLFRNIIKSLDEFGILIVRENILKYYKLFMELFHKNVKKEDKEEYKKIAIINKEQEEVIISMIKEEIEKENNEKVKQRKKKEKEKEKMKEKIKNNQKGNNFEIDDMELES
jgi:alpha-galactosidase/6-phospho-beta-glucosidase family protein